MEIQYLACLANRYGKVDNGNHEKILAVLL